MIPTWMLPEWLRRIVRPHTPAAIENDMPRVLLSAGDISLDVRQGSLTLVIEPPGGGKIEVAMKPGQAREMAFTLWEGAKLAGFNYHAGVEALS